MNKKQAFEFLAASSIPFQLGQSSVYGCDCVGLVVVYYNLQNIEFNVNHIRRRVTREDSFLASAMGLGLSRDKAGDIVIFGSQGTGHCGITDGLTIVSQNNIENRTICTPLFPQTLRYSLKKGVKA